MIDWPSFIRYYLGHIFSKYRVWPNTLPHTQDYWGYKSPNNGSRLDYYTNVVTEYNLTPENQRVL